MPKFSFDLTLQAAVTVEAHSELEARLMITEHFQCADCNGGLWPSGEPVLFEASIDGEPECFDHGDDS